MLSAESAEHCRQIIQAMEYVLKFYSPSCLRKGHLQAVQNQITAPEGTVWSQSTPFAFPLFAQKNLCAIFFDLNWPVVQITYKWEQSQLIISMGINETRNTGNTMKVMSSQSVYLATLLLHTLSPQSG